MENRKNIPTLRFPEFTGEWEKKKLGFIGKYFGGGTPDTSVQEYWEGNIPWISSSDIIENDIHNINIQKHITDEAIKNSATKKIPDNSLIIVSRVGVGKFAINKNMVCTSQDFTNIVIDTKLFNANFSAFNLYKNIDILYSISQGTSIKGFTTIDLKKIELSFPSLPEQTKIANFLTAVDEKLQALKKKKSLLEQYKKGVMQKLFSQELRFKDENGKPFPDWEVKKLGEVATKKSSNISANKIEENFGEFIIYGASGILKYIDFYEEESDYISIVKDGAGVGRLLYCKGKSSVLGTMEIIKPTEGISAYYLFCLLSNIDFTKYITGSTIPHIYFKDYKNEDCGIPCLEEQTLIANFLSALDDKINQTQALIEKTELWKKGLLQKMFV
jgi:type I restriction enzyme S subunit